jgi:hypothetical protein
MERFRFQIRDSYSRFLQEELNVVRRGESRAQLGDDDLADDESS